MKPDRMPHMLFARRQSRLSSGFAICVAVTGCAKAPPAAEVALVRDPAEPPYRRTLSTQDRNQIEAAFGSLAADHNADRRPQLASDLTDGQRWSDMEAAVLYACDDTEMAVIARKQTFGGADGRQSVGWEFTLRTAEDWPGMLTIHRLPIDPTKPSPQSVYEAAAEIGRFGDHTQRVEALLAAIDRQLTAFGRKKRLEE